MGKAAKDTGTIYNGTFEEMIPPTDEWGQYIAEAGGEMELPGYHIRDAVYYTVDLVT